MNFSIGDTLGAYRILQELGRGAMGSVFKVEHTITQRLEAMKVLEGGRPDAPEQAARSLREIQLQASLDHPNIAAVHYAFWEGENLVLVMELIEGHSLRSALQGQRLPLATALDYARQALAALSYAHEHGVIHRDISPANMMITSLGVLKVADFGLAKGPADVRLSHSGAPLGSPHYMSPEQVRGGQAGVRSDIYALGVVLYELTTGKKPFDGESTFSIMEKHTGTPPVPPIEVEPSLPQALNTAILRALEKDPTRRFPSAQEFLQALTYAPTASRSSLRSGVVWAAASFAVVCLAIAGLYGSQHWHWPGKPPATVVAPHPGSLVQESKPAVEAPSEPIAPAPAAARIIHRKPPSVVKRTPNEAPAATIVASEPVPTPTPENASLENQSPESAPVTAAPAKEEVEATAPRSRNPVAKAIGKLWRLGRHKKPSESPAP